VSVRKRRCQFFWKRRVWYKEKNWQRRLRTDTKI